MRKTLSPLLLLMLTSTSFALTPFQSYLQKVYPTSTTIKNFTPLQAEHFYLHRIHFWYRIPSSNNPNGLLSNAISAKKNIFLVPDTIATDGNTENTFTKNGFEIGRAHV